MPLRSRVLRMMTSPWRIFSALSAIAVIAVGISLVLSYWRYREQTRLVERRELELEHGPAVAGRVRSISTSRALAQIRPNQGVSAALPSGSSCSTGIGSGTAHLPNATNVVAPCTSATIGGTVSGLSSGQSVVLFNDGTDPLTVAGNGGFKFSTALPAGGKYTVSVKTQPAGVTCIVGDGSGTASSANITSVTVSCSVAAEKILYSFGASRSDGVGPTGGLIMDSAGKLYGTTKGGGAHGDGTVFEISPAGAETILYSFGASSTDGRYPDGKLAMDRSGNLYGITISGGADNSGTVFQISPAGEEHVLYSFSFPHPPEDDDLVIDGSGDLYGTTAYGGANSNCEESGDGAVFEINPAGREAVLHSFGHNSTDGCYPVALAISTRGELFGTTASGGAHDGGTVFKISPAGDETVLYSFGASRTDGSFPARSLVIDSTGNLYGATRFGRASRGNSDLGGGTVFEFSPSGKESVLYTLAGAIGNGAFETVSGLTIGGDGTLYGTTDGGGAHFSGILFEISSASGKETLLYSFGASSTDAKSPEGSLAIDRSGNLYGVTTLGGAYGSGAVFEITLPNRARQVSLGEGPQSEAGAEPTSDQGLQSAPSTKTAQSGQGCDVVPNDEPASAIPLAPSTQRAEDSNKWYEDRRQKLCAKLPTGEHCEPAARVFGTPPEGSIRYTEKLQICGDETGACSPSAPRSSLSGAGVPVGCFLQRTQFLTILTKAHGSQSFTGNMTYSWESGEFGEIDPDQGRDWYGLPDFDQINRYFWVGDEGYEDGGTSLISYDTGKVALSVQDATLLMSPDGTHLLAYWDQVDSEPGDNDIAIYTLSDDAINQVAGLNVACANPDFVWVTSSEIAIFGCYVPHSGEIAYIRQKGSAWVLDPRGK